jgi:hypothetical protein
MGLNEQVVHINGRPIQIASYLNEDASAHKVPMRQAFPAAGTSYLGGEIHFCGSHFGRLLRNDPQFFARGRLWPGTLT